MESDDLCNPTKLRQLILSSKEPFVIKQHLNWKLLKWTLKDWQQLLKNDQLLFRCGTKSFTKEPQWERRTVSKSATFEEFLSCSQSQSENWMYFDYKYLREWFKNLKELKTSINWSSFGFPELTSEDSTIWIGSEGAHTPCHIDTYGCNLIAQIYGKKQWILFPPEENLKMTRIPYEESSIYSTLNFYSPTIEDFKGVKNCRIIILEPGDVLCVPHKWWHYVENLEFAISINVWLPLPVDDEERLTESLVQFFIAQVAQNLDEDVKKGILNPNSDEDIGNMTLKSSLDLINKCKSVFLKNIKEGTKSTEVYSLEKSAFLHQVLQLSDEDFFKFLQKQRSRFTNEAVEQELHYVSHDLHNLINAFTHSDTIKLVKDKLLQ